MLPPNTLHDNACAIDNNVKDIHVRLYYTIILFLSLSLLLASVILARAYYEK